jgi:hypothetical protein
VEFDSRIVVHGWKATKFRMLLSDSRFRSTLTQYVLGGAFECDHPMTVTFKPDSTVGSATLPTGLPERPAIERLMSLHRAAIQLQSVQDRYPAKG